MMQITELHFRRTPTCDYAAVKARTQEILECDLESSDPGESDKAFLIVHKDHPVKYADGEIQHRRQFWLRISRCGSKRTGKTSNNRGIAGGPNHCWPVVRRRVWSPR